MVNSGVVAAGRPGRQRSAQAATLLEFHVPLTNCFVRRWFCAVHGPKPPSHRHNWLSFGKFQDTERFLIHCARHFSSRLPPSGGTCKYAKVPSTKKTLRDSLPIDMLLSVVSVLVVAQSSSEVPEGLMNNPVYRIGSIWWEGVWNVDEYLVSMKCDVFHDWMATDTFSRRDIHRDVWSKDWHWRAKNSAMNEDGGEWSPVLWLLALFPIQNVSGSLLCHNGGLPDLEECFLGIMIKGVTCLSIHCSESSSNFYII